MRIATLATALTQLGSLGAAATVVALGAASDALPVRGVPQVDAQRFAAVVSEPSRETLWILSCTPTMDRVQHHGIVARLRCERYPVEDLVPTPQQSQRQPPAAAIRPRLMV